MIDLILYHGDCPDGHTAAWVFWHHFNLLDDLVYHMIGCQHSQPPPDVTGKKVAILDFSYKRDVLTEMASKAESILILDHHKSAEMDLMDLNLSNVKCVFDMTRSGAQIAWDYCNMLKGREVMYSRPWFIDYVADRDLWHHRLPHTHEISAAMQHYGYFREFLKLEVLYRVCCPNEVPVLAWKSLPMIEQLIETGSVLVEVNKKECDEYARYAVPTLFCGKYKVYLAGCPRKYRSEVGNLICTFHKERCDFSAVYWFDFKSQEWWISLRARDDSKIDLSVITSQIPNGGGHPKAAGFSCKDINEYFVMSEDS